MLRKGLIRDPDFLKLWVGQAISQIGSNITGVGLPFTAVLVLGASPLQMGFLAGAGAVAVLVFGLFAGAWADRLRRRPILIAADMGRAVVLGMIPLLAAPHRSPVQQFQCGLSASRSRNPDARLNPISAGKSPRGCAPRGAIRCSGRWSDAQPLVRSS